MVADTRFAKGSEGWVAYQVVGDGPATMVVSKPWFFPVDLMWEEPSFVQLLEGFSSFCTSIWLDCRGTGASDAIEHVDGRLVESMVDDMVTVLDDVGCEEACVLSWTAPPGLLFAATYPQRTTALMLVNPALRLRSRSGDDLPPGVLDDRDEDFLGALRATWGTGAAAGGFVPSRAGDKRFLQWCGRCERLAMEPAEVYWRLRAVFDVELRHVFPAIRVPTLVVCGNDPGRLPHAQYVAEHVDGAQMVEVDSQDLLILGAESGPMLDAVEEFLTGGLPRHAIDRMLATVMFTDVVRSTESLALAGDRRWRELLASHDTLIRAELARFGGREVKATGDGILATFDGPGRAVRCAKAIRDQLQSLRIEVRVGLHTGEIERHGDDIAGIAVHIAQRVQGLAEPGEVLVSRTVVDLVAGSGLAFADRGSHELKGVPGEWTLFAATP